MKIKIFVMVLFLIFTTGADLSIAQQERPEYKEYVMFGGIEGGFTEIVVASYQKRKMICDENVEYSPGARLYIKNHEIINDKIDVRDGLHLMKVYKRLPLKKYLAAVVTKEDVCLEKEENFWTPKRFAAKANIEFERLLRTRQCLTSRTT